MPNDKAGEALKTEQLKSLTLKLLGICGILLLLFILYHVGIFWFTGGICAVALGVILLIWWPSLVPGSDGARQETPDKSFHAATGGVAGGGKKNTRSAF